MVSKTSLAESVVRSMKHGIQLVVPNRSHNDVDPCITSMFESCLIAGSAAALDTSCVALPHPLHFATGPGAPPGR